jgi:hypothetical protein
MASMKYIKDEHGRFIIFDAAFTHKDVADALQIKVESAGMVSLIDSQVSVNGESVTLCKKANPNDGPAIHRGLDFYDGC